MTNIEENKNKYTDLVEVNESHKSMSKAFGYTPEEIAVIQKTVAKGTTKVEFAFFLNVAKTNNLNAFNKEIWCYKDNKDNLLIFTGRDGFLAKAQQNPLFNGIRSGVIRENDEWSVDIPNGSIKHIISKPLLERGTIIYGYAIVFRKNGESTLELSDFGTYKKAFGAWKTHPESMIKKVAESDALKKSFGISGIQSEHEFTYENNIATPVSHQNTFQDVKDKKKKIKTIELP